MKTEKEKRQMLRRLERRIKERTKRDKKIERLQIEIGKLMEVSYL